MANLYKNKVVYYGQTLIDLSSDTVTAETLLEGYTAHRADGALITGTYVPSGGSAITVITTQDPNGGEIKEIVAVDISNDTVTADKLLSGYTAHDKYGNAITGTYIPGGGEAVQANKNVSPTESEQEVTPDSGFDSLAKVTVSAISATYIGSGITRRSSTDLTASGATVTVPAGYYETQATKAISNGSVTPAATISATGATISTSTNTLTLTKTVSNTPQVSAGYISSGTAGNSSVSLSATVNIRSSSDLTASGATVTAPAGYYANAATKSVASGTEGTPTATKGTVSNHSVSVTPSVTNSAGYISGGTKTGTAVSVSASELVSGSQTISSNGTVDVTNLASVTVAVPIVTYYTGSSSPSSSLGSNGDIYLKTS